MSVLKLKSGNSWESVTVIKGDKGDKGDQGDPIDVRIDGTSIVDEDVANIPIASSSVDGIMSSTDKIKLDGIATGAEVNVQSDWDQTTTTADDYIKNKPTIPTVSVTQKTSSGTNIADITINGTTTQLYAPSSGGGLVTDVTVDGTSVVSGGVASIDLTGKADASDIPTKVSDLTNDAGYLTSYTETDPTVPAWAKASTKPTYTASEVGALPDTTSIPSKTSDLTNDSGFLSSETDPVFTASDAYGISSTDISNWDNAYDGNISFDTSAQSGEDYDLTQILTSFGWLNDVIV